jgi:hypothetical protein
MEIKLTELQDLLCKKDLSGGAIAILPEKPSTFLQRGKCYLVRTVTYTIAGTLENFNEKEFLFTACDWIADTGRFADNLKSCSFGEVEPFKNDVVVNRSSFTDITEIDSTPRTQK